MAETAMRPPQAALDRFVTELGALTVALEEARYSLALQHHPAVRLADAALVDAADALTRLLLSEDPDTALQLAIASMTEAQVTVEAARAAIVAAGH